MNALDFFTARLTFQTDVSDVRAALGGSTDAFVLIDSRSDDSWAQGHIPGAVHLPTAEIAARAGALVPAGSSVVTYCWGPGCNGATRAAAEFARLGYAVREMLGGIEYWTREGFPVATAAGDVVRPADPLTAPAGIACAC
ncbi:rhodanese-like domain-containing protein [Actinocatenispora comari]|uniref:Sulfurtransferase n=1 Tax=Actinocatenispora comari TaxID=2807577 RepID=A0A8J4AEX3_9ACTN|nr:rhodanese-like domain-containing protein [Actinocatenispora comari]GIL29803.1 sulfurtransferase [Actinocatenispora comari]